MRSWVAWVLAVALGAGDAAAQTQTPAQAAGKDRAQPLNLRREKLGSGGLGEVARARARNGDCAGAIEAFDAAIRTSPDPPLRRDRGQCHETLAHPYPAIDDYRAYLTARPDAPDADGIRERLARLEQSTMGYSSASVDVPGDVEGGLSASKSGSAKDSASAHASPEASEPIEYPAREDDLLSRALRRGRGWSISPFFSEHKFGASPALTALAPGATPSFGDSGTWAECVGIEGRYSLGPSVAVFAEVGFEHFNSTAVDSAVVSGLTSQVGFEVRSPLDAEYTNQLIAALGVGYEHLVVQPSTAQVSSASVGGFVPRARFGWRHLLAPSAGLEASLDAGAVNFFRYQPVAGHMGFPLDSGDPTTYFLGVNIALVWGL